MTGKNGNGILRLISDNTVGKGYVENRGVLVPTKKLLTVKAVWYPLMVHLFEGKRRHWIEYLTHTLVLEYYDLI